MLISKGWVVLKGPSALRSLASLHTFLHHPMAKLQASYITCRLQFDTLPWICHPGTLRDSDRRGDSSIRIQDTVLPV